MLHQMMAAGFFDDLGGGRYDGAKKFIQLAAAKISDGLTRADADALLARILAKASEVNERADEYRARVDCIVAFGSYLGDKPSLGDLDIAVSVTELPRKTEGKLKFSELRRMMAHQSPTGRVFSELRLRKSKLISVHRLGEVFELGTPFKVVFGVLPGQPGRDE